jgi:hypothetical protein
MWLKRPKSETLIQMPGRIALTHGQSEPPVTGVDASPYGMLDQEAAEPLSLVAGDHEDFRDPRIPRPPLGRGHISDDERTHDCAALVTDNARCLGEHRTTRTFACQQLSPVLEPVHPRPDPEVDVTRQHSSRRGGGDAIHLGVQRLEAGANGERSHRRGPCSDEIDRHVTRKTTLPAPGCEQPGGFGPVMRTNHNHGATLSRRWSVQRGAFTGTSQRRRRCAADGGRAVRR